MLLDLIILTGEEECRDGVGEKARRKETTRKT
jgi:hypothetical protein